MTGLGQILLKEPALDWREGKRPRHCALFSLNFPRHTDNLRQFSNGLMLEKLFRRQSQSGLISPGNDLNAQDGIAA